MAVSMSSRPSGSAEAAPLSVTLRRSPRFDPYKASSAQRAQQRATPRSLKGTIDPSPFAVVPPVLVPKKKRKTSTTSTTSADRARTTSRTTRGPSSSLKENEAKAFRQTAAFTVSASHLASTKRRLDETEAVVISPIKTRSTRRSVAAVSKEQTEFTPALRRLLKKSNEPATTQDEVLPRAIIKSVKATEQPCAVKEKVAADAQQSTTVNGRFLRPRHRVAGSVIAQTCKTTAASLYKSIVTTILPNSASKGRKCRKLGVAVAVSTSQPTTPKVQELVASSSTSAPIAPSNDSSFVDSVTESLVIGDLSPAAPSEPSSNSSPTGNPTTHTPTIAIPSTAPIPASSIPEVSLATPHSHIPDTSYSESPKTLLATPQLDSLAIPISEGAEPLSPYQDVVAVPTSPLSSYPAPSTYDTVDMGSMPNSDIQSPIANGTSELRSMGSFVESTYSTLTYALTPVPHPVSASIPPSSLPAGDATSADANGVSAYAPFVPCIPATPQFGEIPVDSYAPYSPVSSSCGTLSPSFPPSSPSSSSTAVFGEELMQGIQVPHLPYLQVHKPEDVDHSAAVDGVTMSIDVLSERAKQSENIVMVEHMDVSMELADSEVPASESDLGFGFVPQEQVQTIQLPEVSFIVPAPTTEEYVAPTFWPRHAKLTVEWNMFSKSQRWHEYLAQIHAQLLVVPNPGLRKEGNLKRLYVVPDLKPMHEVGHQLNDRSLFVSMSRGRVLEICRRMGAETIRDIVADEAWRFFNKTGVFPTNFARTCMRNPLLSQPQPQHQSSQPDPAPVHVSKADSKGEEDVEESIIDFMSEEIYDFELEDEDAMEEDDDTVENIRLDPRLPARFRVYFPEEDDDEDEPAEVAGTPVESNPDRDDDDADVDSDYSDDSDEDDDMELIASTDGIEPESDGASGCSFIQLDLQLPAQEPTSPTSLAPQEALFHVPISHQVNFDQSAWEDARQLYGVLQSVQDASRQGLANPPPPRPINVGTLKIPLNIPSFASIRLRCLTASDSYSCGQLPLRGTKADKVINYAWHLSPPPVAATDFSEHHARTGSVAIRPPRVYRHAIIKPAEVIRSFLKAAFVEVAQTSQNRKRVREQQDQDAEDLERSRPRLRLDNGITDQQASSSTSTGVSTIQDSSMAWMSMAETQPQQGMDTSFQTGLQYQSTVLEAAYTQVTDMFQQDGVWYYGMPPATGNDFPPVHHAPPQIYTPSTSSSLSNALG